MGSDLTKTDEVAVPDDFNPRSPYGERQINLDWVLRQIKISTHAPRMGSDIQRAKAAYFGQLISTHAPRMGSDQSA